MKLFYWTKEEFDSCDHYAAFADTELEARNLIAASINADWKPPEGTDKKSREFRSWWEECRKRDVKYFLTNPKWKLRVYEIAPGVWMETQAGDPQGKMLDLTEKLVLCSQQLAAKDAEIEALKRQRDDWMKVSHAWEDDVTKLAEENESLKRQLSEVDDVLIVNWVGPRKDGDYRKALADLITTNVREALDPSLGGPVKELREENEALKKKVASAQILSTFHMSEVARYQRGLHLQRQENESLKRERAEIAEELGHYRAVQEIDPSSDAFLDTCEDLETLRASAQSLIFTTRTLQKRAERERDEFKKAFTQADKDAINALWNFDPEIPYTAGGFGPGFVIDIFRTHLQVAWATIAELKQDQLETRDLLETHRLRIEAHMNTIAEQAKLIERQRDHLGKAMKAAELFRSVVKPYGLDEYGPNSPYNIWLQAKELHDAVARALEAKEGTK